MNIQYLSRTFTPSRHMKTSLGPSHLTCLLMVVPRSGLAWLTNSGTAKACIALRE
jgi:hypothetical protein